MTNENNQYSYAHLPEDLIKKILDEVPHSVEKMNKMLDTQDAPIQKGMDLLRKKSLIEEFEDDPLCTDSLMAVDGGNIIEKMSGTDILLAVAVGVEGLASSGSDGWLQDKNQYDQWQSIMPHDEATPRLCQGVMFLMELSVLSGASHNIRIMDGAHFTPLLKINSMLSAKEEYAGKEYIQGLRDFLRKRYKVIPDIPDIIKAAFNDEHIIALAKYSSSRDILDEHVKNPQITLDDKAFFTLGLHKNQHTLPLPVGQSQEERRKIWDDLHIRCNLGIAEEDDLNEQLEKAIAPIRTKQNGIHQKSNLFFSYYKPHENGPAYRVECKKTLADDSKKFKRMLSNLQNQQRAYPDIREPFPQYLADLMAKSVSGGMYALQDAIRLSSNLSVKSNRFDFLFPYRSN